ncbi:hypothetical protein [Streptosporangium sp. NPDC003464]
MTYSTRIVGALALLLLAGCSSPRPEQQVASLKPLSVKEEASSVLKGDDGYVVNWAGVLANSNPWHFGEHVVATVIATDAKGKEVVRLEQPLDAVPPAGVLSFTGQVVAAERPSRVSIQYRPAEWHQAARIVSAFRSFPVSDVLTERKEHSYLITGYVGTPYRLPAGSLAVTALLRDKNGKLLGGGSTFVDDVRAGAKRRFILNIESVPDTSKIAKAELVARTWGSSSRPYEELALGGIAPVHTAKPTTAPFVKDRGGPAVSTGDARP